jgi:AraC-like DNA-binding protein
VSVLFRSEHAPIESRFDYWRHVIGNSLVPLETRFDHAPDFPAQILTSEIGPVRLTDSATGPGASFRTPKMIRRSDPDVYMISVLISGEMTVEQDDRQDRLQPGDLAFFDPSRPARRIFSAMRNVVVSVPRAMLPFSQDDLAQLTAVRIPGDRGAGALGSALARQLATSADDVTAAEAARLAPTVVDLLSVALASRLDRARTVPIEAQHRARLHRVYAFIESELSDPDLSPASVAAAQHVSIRYLHKLFEAQPTTVGKWIRQRRLERCRQDLLDPALAERPVSAIAARWGVLNSAHFSRAFRTEYGLPPAEYRTLHNPFPR